MGTYFIKEIVKLKLNILWAEIVRECFAKLHFLIQGNIMFKILFNTWNVFFCSICLLLMYQISFVVASNINVNFERAQNRNDFFI